MTNRIYLAGIVERGGRILLIRPTPAAQWELPGGPLLQRHPDADVAMGEILETFGIKVPAIEEGFLETIYLPEGDGHIVYNLYHAADWEGEPDIPIGMGAGWYAFDELDAIDVREEIRNSVLVAYGLREPASQDAAILQAMAGAATDPGALQPPLVPIPVFEEMPAEVPVGTATATDAWARPGDPLHGQEAETVGEAEIIGTAPAAGTEQAAESADFGDPGFEIGTDQPSAHGAIDQFLEVETPGGASDMPLIDFDAAPDLEASFDEPGDVAGGADRAHEGKLLQFPVQEFDVRPDDLSAQDGEAGIDAVLEVPGALFNEEGDPIDEAPADEVELPDERFADDGSDVDADAPPTPIHRATLADASEAVSRRLKGYDVLRTLGGGAADPVASHERLRGQNPELADDIVDFALGEVWATDRLDRKTRSLQVVAMLAALGGRQGPLRSHINGALNHGATPDEVVETLRMVAVYAGFPAALEAWGPMEAVFEARGVKPGGRP